MAAPNFHQAVPGSGFEDGIPLNFTVAEASRQMFYEPAIAAALEVALGRLFYKSGVTSAWDPKEAREGPVVAVVVLGKGGHVTAYVPQGYIRTPADPYIFGEVEGMDP